MKSKPLLAAEHVDEKFRVFLYDELKARGPNALSVLLADIIQNARVAFGWDVEAIMDGLEVEIADPTDHVRRMLPN